MSLLGLHIDRKHIIGNFIGTFGVVKFYHRPVTKPGHLVLTRENGLGEIVTIAKPEIKFLDKYTYGIKLFKEDIIMYLKSNDLKYIVVYPTDFKANKTPILLSFADYPFASPKGMVTGRYTFTVTKRGYAKMTEKTYLRLGINNLLHRSKQGKEIYNYLIKHNLIIKKRDNEKQKDNFIRKSKNVS